MNATQPISRGQQLADSLRRLADAVAALPDMLVPNVKASVHGVSSLDELKLLARMMSHIRAQERTGTHWIAGDFGKIEVVAFYEAGLLGKVTRTAVVEVEADLSLLKSDNVLDDVPNEGSTIISNAEAREVLRDQGAEVGAK